MPRALDKGDPNAEEYLVHRRDTLHRQNWREDIPKVKIKSRMILKTMGKPRTSNEYVRIIKTLPFILCE